MATIEPSNFKGEQVTLAGKTYTDIVSLNEPAKSAYIQCSWFNDKQIKHMEAGLKAIGQNPTVSLKRSHHPLSHQYNDINVEEHPEVMEDFEWQACTYAMDMSNLYGNDLGIGLYVPSAEDSGQAYEQGALRAAHIPNILVIPDEEADVPLNLMIGMGNTRIIKLSELATFDFNDVTYVPYTGKVF